MAFYDWNGDGKNDLTDDITEHNIYRNCVVNGNNRREPRFKPLVNMFWTVFLINCAAACLNELFAANILRTYLLFQFGFKIEFKA